MSKKDFRYQSDRDGEEEKNDHRPEKGRNFVVSVCDRKPPTFWDSSTLDKLRTRCLA